MCADRPLAQRDRRLLAAVVRWHAEAEPRLESMGLTSELRGPTSGLSKDNAAVFVAGADQVTSVVVWDSGEAEVITALESEDAPRVEVGVVRVPSDVEELLNRAAARLAAPEMGG